MAKREPTAGKVRPGKVKLVVARVEDIDTREGMARFYEALVGERPTEQELDEAFAEEETSDGATS